MAASAESPARIPNPRVSLPGADGTRAARLCACASGSHAHELPCAADAAQPRQFDFLSSSDQHFSGADRPKVSRAAGKYLALPSILGVTDARAPVRPAAGRKWRRACRGGCRIRGFGAGFADSARIRDTRRGFGTRIRDADSGHPAGFGTPSKSMTLMAAAGSAWVSRIPAPGSRRLLPET